jgi:multidrug efflux system membrane fusion protein
MKKRIVAWVLTVLVLAPVSQLGAAESVSGVVHWSQRVEMGTLVSGVVSTVHVRPGQVVEQGDPLVTLDKRGFASRVQRWLAEFRHAESLLAEAKREDERAAELYDRTVLSDFERNRALIELDAARAKLALSRAHLVEARLDLERSEIKAPFAGVVLSVAAVPGQQVTSQLQIQPLVTLADNRNLQVRAEVDAAQAARLVAGREIRVSAGGTSVPGAVGYVGLEALPRAAETRYELLVNIDGRAASTLRVGQRVEIELE